MPASNGLGWWPSTTFQGAIQVSTLYLEISLKILCFRWKMFFKTLEQCLVTGSKFDSDAFKVIFKTKESRKAHIILIQKYQRDFVKKQGTPFTTSRALFPTEPEGDTIQVRNVPPSLNRLSLSSAEKKHCQLFIRW